MKIAIVWLTTDLRIRDNETLVQGMAQADQIIPVVCLAPNDLANTSFGFPKMGYFRMRFFFEALEDLDQQLRAQGSGLILSLESPEIAIPSLAKAYQAEYIYTKEQVGFEELETQQKVREALLPLQAVLETVNTFTLYHPEDLPFALSDLPDVFTKFRITLEKNSKIRSRIEAPKSLNSPSIPALKIPSFSELGIPEIPLDARSALPLVGGETAGQARLQDYLFGTRAALTYKETRNGLIGLDYSTKFSAYLAFGCLSARDIYWTLAQFESQVEANESTYWIKFELMWRDYFWFLMKKRPRSYFRPSGLLGSHPLHGLDPAILARWIEGETGQLFIDANMRELAQTGFMSNRGRQNVASFFCHTLQQDWRYGAAYFESQLVDYDVSSNWGNWAYVAGVGNDPRPDRRFNTEKQAEVYDPQQTYQHLWLN
jgi:deoxyribodipyrimidine photo-lyase